MLRLFCAIIILSVTLIMSAAQEGEPLITDRVEHSVEFSELIIDDFSNFSDRFLPYSEASYDDVLRARNRIRPFCRTHINGCFMPEYESLAEAGAWLEADSLIIGYIAADNTAYAFPIKLLTFHEIVNDDLAGEPILVTYSPHSSNAAIYSRRVNNINLDFGNTSIYYQNLSTVYDVQSESLWLTTSGSSILGEDIDKQLERLASIVTTWQEWSSLHPDSLVLSRRPRYVNYDQNLFSEYETRLNLGRFVFPVSATVLDDTRLRYADEVLLLERESEVKAYSFDSLNNQMFIDRIGGQDFLLIGHSAAGITVPRAYKLQLEDGRFMALEFEKVGDKWIEIASQSVLDANGHFTGGELDGHYLLSASTARMYWFAAVATYPQLQLYESAPS